MRKITFITAALAVIFMLPVFSMTAYALGDEPDGQEEQPAAVAYILPENEEYTNPTAEQPVPFTPGGTGTVVDQATDADGKFFYTIVTPDEHIFYLVIDTQRGSENVYFLNAVTIADLAALAELPPPPQTPTITPPVDVPEIQEETTPPTETEEPEQGGIGMYIIIIVLAVLGAGAGWYFKIYRPKQGAASADEYDPSLDDTENDYSDEYADDWGEDTDDSVDAATWDGETESGDE